MCTIDRGFLHHRGYLKILELIFGAITFGLNFEGRGYFTNYKGYRHAHNFCWIAPVIMLVITGILFLINLVKWTENLGGRYIWNRLDFYFGCLLGFILYVIVLILGVGYLGVPKFDYDYGTADILIAGAVFAALTLIPYFIETCLTCREVRVITVRT